MQRRQLYTATRVKLMQAENQRKEKQFETNIKIVKRDKITTLTNEAEERIEGKRYTPHPHPLVATSGRGWVGGVAHIISQVVCVSGAESASYCVEIIRVCCFQMANEYSVQLSQNQVVKMLRMSDIGIVGGASYSPAP